MKTDVELETRKLAFHLLCVAAKSPIDGSSNTTRQSNLCLIAYGRRRAQNFVLCPGHSLSPAFGLEKPKNLWRALSTGKRSELTTIEEVEKLRSFAQMCGFANDHCVIRFRLADTPPHIFAYTTAVPTPRRPLKRFPEGKIKNIRTHVCWVTDASHDRSSATTNIAQTLEYVDPADLISLGGEKCSDFA